MAWIHYPQAILGPSKTGLTGTLRYRVLQYSDGTVLVAYTTAGVQESAVAGDYTVPAGVGGLPDATPVRFEWSTVALGALAEEVVNPLLTPDNGSIASILARLPSALVGGRMDSSVGSYPGNTPQTGDNFARLGAPAGASVSADIATVNAKTTNLPASPAATGAAMALTPGERDAVAAALLDLASSIEAGLTVRGALRLALAGLGGKLSGAGTATETFRNAVADTKPRITATVDMSGNRSAVVTDTT